ncbi:MAG: 2-oxoacid:acceptor oxidoreductase family protein [Candidatus Thorarchaeota archaeon]|nr:2-oxoacid:acceptor oxidoreductase family protein [Candidatus Thorarchaeota archaeon]
MDRPYNILIAGVGGQGNLLAGSVLAEAAALAGYRPVVGEIYGASRRGGRVMTHVRIWKEDLGPLIPAGHTDFLIGLEPVETIWAADVLCSERSVVVMNKAVVPTLSTLTGLEKYPSVENIEKALKEICGSLFVMDATDTLNEFNNPKALNMFFLGSLVALGKSPLSKEQITEGIKKNLRNPASSIAIFERGIEISSKLA